MIVEKMVFVEVLVAMMCEDPEEHKLIRKAKQIT